MPRWISPWPSPACSASGRFSPGGSGPESCPSLLLSLLPAAEVKRFSFSDLLPAALIKETKPSWIDLPGRCFNCEGLRLYRRHGLQGKLIPLIKPAGSTG